MLQCRERSEGSTGSSSCRGTKRFCAVLFVRFKPSNVQDTFLCAGFLLLWRGVLWVSARLLVCSLCISKERLQVLGPFGLRGFRSKSGAILNQLCSGCLRGSFRGLQHFDCNLLGKRSESRSAEAKNIRHLQLNALRALRCGL